MSTFRIGIISLGKAFAPLGGFFVSFKSGPHVRDIHNLMKQVRIHASKYNIIFGKEAGDIN